jgi:futalosine hydrolase
LAIRAGSIRQHIAIIAATPGELQLIGASLDSPAAPTLGEPAAGTLSGRPCRLVVTGMAPVNAAHALTREVERRGRPALVIQVGIGGAFVQSGLSVGAVALATEEVYGDVGVITPDGWLSSEGIGIPLVPAAEGASAATSGQAAADRPARFNQFPLDAALVERAARVCGARTGRFLTLSQVTGVRALADELHARFGAVCESMEGAAAAHVCALYDLPFLEVRGISNLVEDRDRSKWRIPEAARAAQDAVLKVVEHLQDVQP